MIGPVYDKRQWTWVTNRWINCLASARHQAIIWISADICCKLHPLEQNSVKLQSKYNDFHPRKSISKSCLQNIGHFVHKPSIHVVNLSRGYLWSIYPYKTSYWDISLFTVVSWWRHQMEACSAFLALCAGNPPVTAGLPPQRPVTRNFDVLFIYFFDLRLSKRLSKQSGRRWFVTPSRSLWRHCNGLKHCCANDYLLSLLLYLLYDSRVSSQWTCLETTRLLSTLKW